jgi:hypothetical protein
MTDFAVSLGDRRHPGVSGECGEDSGKDGNAMLGGGGQVAADGVPVPGGCFRAEPTGDLLLYFRRAHVSFGLVGRRRDAQVGEEPQYVVAAVVQAFQQQPARRLLLVAAGDAADLR